MSWFADPEGLHRQAARLTTAAERVRDRADEVRATSASAQWRGTAADAFHASVAREAGVLDRAADGLDDAARALHRHADAVAAELNRLRALERAAEAVLIGGLSRLAGLAP